MVASPPPERYAGGREERPEPGRDLRLGLDFELFGTEDFLVLLGLGREPAERGRKAGRAPAERERRAGRDKAADAMAIGSGRESVSGLDRRSVRFGFYFEGRMPRYPYKLSWR